MELSEEGVWLVVTVVGLDDREVWALSPGTTRVEVVWLMVD